MPLFLARLLAGKCTPEVHVAWTANCAFRREGSLPQLRGVREAGHYWLGQHAQLHSLNIKVHHARWHLKARAVCGVCTDASLTDVDCRQAPFAYAGL